MNQEQVLSHTRMAYRWLLRSVEQIMQLSATSDNRNIQVFSAMLPGHVTV